MLLLVGSAELGARAFLPEPALVRSGPLGWTMRPDLRDHPVDQADPQVDFTVSTNPDGLRTRHERTRRARRVVTLGESTVFGWGLPPEEAPAGVLEALLGSDWEVVNAGQPGYSSEQARRLAEALVPVYDPEVVVWFHPWSDLTPAQATDRDRLPAVLSGPTFWRNSRLLTWLADPSGRRGTGLQNNALMPLRHATPGQTQRVPRAQRSENLAALALACRDRALLVVLLPNDITAIDVGKSPLAIELEQTAERIGASWLDLSPKWSPEEFEEFTLPGDPGHFNRLGNQQLMAPLAVHLSRQNVQSP